MKGSGGGARFFAQALGSFVGNFHLQLMVYE